MLKNIKRIFYPLFFLLLPALFVGCAKPVQDNIPPPKRAVAQEIPATKTLKTAIKMPEKSELYAKSRKRGVYKFTISKELVALWEEDAGDAQKVETPGALKSIGLALVKKESVKEGVPFIPALLEKDRPMPFTGSLIVRVKTEEDLERIMTSENIQGLQLKTTFAKTLVKMLIDRKTAHRLYETAEWLSNDEGVIACEPEMIRKYTFK